MKISDNKKTFVLIMTRKKIVLPDDSIQKKNRKLSKYIGAGKGIFGSPKKVDKFILTNNSGRFSFFKVFYIFYDWASSFSFNPILCVVCG